LEYLFFVSKKTGRAFSRDFTTLLVHVDLRTLLVFVFLCSMSQIIVLDKPLVFNGQQTLPAIVLIFFT
jgi:hypothetical protein